METARQRAREEDAWFRPSSAGAESESESESESEADAPPPPKRTRVKREQAPEAEEAESRVKAKVKKEAGEGKGITEKKKDKVAVKAVKAPSRPKKRASEPRRCGFVTLCYILTFAFTFSNQQQPLPMS